MAYLAYASEIFQGEAELGEHFFVRNGFVILEPFPGPFDSVHLFLADRFAINGSVGETAGHRIADRVKSVETTFECGRFLPRSPSLQSLTGVDLLGLGVP